MKMMKSLALAIVALVAFTSCAEQNENKFNEKEYAERKTNNLDEIVNLTEDQKAEIYAIYEAQGLEIKENIKNMKCGDPRPNCSKKAECDKKDNCPKVNGGDPANCPKKAECDKKADCPKLNGGDPANCPKKAECDRKAECPKLNGGDPANCPKKAECEKRDNCPKVNCDPANCPKVNGGDPANCPKKAECEKRANCPKKGVCDSVGRRPHRHHRHHHMVAPEQMKATMDKVMNILTPEQQEAFKAHRANRRQCAKSMKACCPTPNATPAAN